MRFTISLVVLLIVSTGVAGWYFFYAPNNDFEEGSTFAYQVKRMSLKRVVSLNGIVEPEKKVELSFERNGKVKNVYTSVGEKVVAGMLLVELENSDLLADLARAEADLAAEKADLSGTEKGPTEEDNDIANIRVKNAERAIEDSRNELLARIIDTYTKVDDAIRNRLDRFINYPQSPRPELAISGGNSAIRQSIESGRASVELLLNDWHKDISELTGTLDFSTVIAQSYVAIDSVRAILRNTTFFLDPVTSSISLTQETLDNYRADVSAGRANVESVRIALILSEEKFNSAVSTLRLTEGERRKVRAGFTQDEIDAARARVKRAEAQVLKVKSDFSKTVIRSPITGVISRFETKKGEAIVSGKVIVTAMATHYLIRVNIPEADITKVKIDDHAIVTLDAYGSGEPFPAILTNIEPAEEIIQGVATYKSTLEFETQDLRIKSGMTANINIVTSEKTDVLAVPQRAVIRRGENRYIRVANARNEPEERKVEVGIVDSKGFVEITEGLSEGESVVVY
ncbi:MAG: hypothetical protein UW83_C0005G0003 [Parcubacteria group bacterium GW2011_GWD1_44_9]|nr:hypothetical protein [uncultured bacterium]KKT15187.1 MAG: hypothetical protein UV94_C0002G0014 [Parcubacteria group bacterium GW2011_GWC1_43_30]KKT85943.1 MAG: hypothetical protein UW83_C0005G0003 [Parcubacteria group bacterium GW2011_GWD1_44_9]